MTNFVKKSGQWFESEFSRKNSTGFTKPGTNVRSGSTWVVTGVPNSLTIVVEALTATSLKVETGALVSTERVDTLEPIPYNTTTKTLTFPAGSYGVKIVLEEASSFALQINTIVTSIESLNSYRGSSYPVLKSSKLVSVPAHLPSSVTSLANAFINCTAFNQVLNFDTSNVTNMNSVFFGCSVFNQPVNFDTSKVTTMSTMFYQCSVFNQPVSFTDTSKVTGMYGMFRDCAAFNQPVNFDTSKVVNMGSMFNNATNFNQDVSGFDTTSATSWVNFRTGSALTTENTPAKFR